jgi:exopolyphosphatase/guanosine-5'-triphosphate,3'-diphosphate pyrophosphatase
MCMRMGALDVGSNTIRLLVARVEHGEIIPVDGDKVRLPLGEEIERFGAVSSLHVAAAAKAVRKLTKRARSHSVESLDVFLTAPGRQSANADELVAALTHAAGAPVRVLSTDEEGRLAYRGAVATAPVELPGRIAVCDVGGASTEVAAGSPHASPDWLVSVDLGSVRLTARVASVAEAQAEVAAAFEHIEPPRVDAVLAVGGSARAARRLVGSHLGPDELVAALRLVENESERTIARRFGVDRSRAAILPAGIVLLAEVQRRLGVPLHVCNGGIREGAILETAAARAA